MNRVVLTGTGVPVPDPERAGAGTLVEAVVGTHDEAIAAHHADAVDLGAAAERAGVGSLVLTHLIPPPTDGYEPFVEEVRSGGFTGELVAGPDLTSVSW